MWTSKEGKEAAERKMAAEAREMYGSPNPPKRVVREAYTAFKKVNQRKALANNQWQCPACGRTYDLGVAKDDYPNECECGTRPSQRAIDAILERADK